MKEIQTAILFELTAGNHALSLPPNSRIALHTDNMSYITKLDDPVNRSLHLVAQPKKVSFFLKNNSDSFFFIKFKFFETK